MNLGTKHLFDKEDVQTLVKLGLNVSQTKIYLALVSLGTANAKKISQTAKIDNAEVYRQLEKLCEKALIEKILKNPTEYKPFTLNEATEILLKNRKKEDEKIRKEVKILLTKIENTKLEIYEEDKISIIPKDAYRIQNTLKELKRAQKEVLWYTQIERIPVTITYYGEQWVDNFARGVKHRTIAELNKPTENVISFIREYKEKNPNFDIRFVNPNLLITFGIFDNKIMHFSTDRLTGVANSRILCTNNAQLIKVNKEYFELRWKSAMKEAPKKR